MPPNIKRSHSLPIISHPASLDDRAAGARRFNRRASMLPQYAGLHVNTCCDKVPYEPNSPASSISWPDMPATLSATSNFPRIDNNTAYLMKRLARLSNQKAQEKVKNLHPAAWNPSAQVKRKKTKRHARVVVAQLFSSGQDRIPSTSSLTPEQLRNQIRDEIRQSHAGPAFFRLSHREAYQQCQKNSCDGVRHSSAWR